jgi:ABC-2 type transport system permease protein
MGVSMMVLFPLTFLSNVFVDPVTMPGWLQAFVKVNPITHLVDGVRSVMAGTPNGSAIMWLLIESAAFIVIFGYLTMRRYNRQ